MADAMAVIETFAEKVQHRHVWIQEPSSRSRSPLSRGVSSCTNALVEDEDKAVSALGTACVAAAYNTAVIVCENAPSCKWFVRLLFIKGEKKWKLSSINLEHHKTHCQESKRVIAIRNDSVSELESTLVTTSSLMLKDCTTPALDATSKGETAAAMGASVYAGMVFVDWKEAIRAIRDLADQMGRRAMAEKAACLPWRGKSVMARRVVCQNYRNSNCGWMVVLDESSDGSGQYTVLSMSLLHSRECLETCNFNARKKTTPALTEVNTRASDSMDVSGLSAEGSSLNSSLLIDVASNKYQLTHEMRWSSGKEATKAISDFTLVVQRKRSKLCKRNNGGSNKKYVCSDEQCLWFVQLVKGWKSKNWKISAMNLKHSDTCTGVPKPTARQLAEMRFFRQAVITHSKSSGKLLTDNFLMHSESGIHIPRGMAYRAQRLVVATSSDDLTESYKYIPSLLESFAMKNPGSISTFEKDTQGHFVRAFVMPNASTAVLAAQQQIFGIHVLHYDTMSYQGYMALLITRDGNFRYQVLAFALLPTNDVDQMKWFFMLAKRGGASFDGKHVLCSHSEHGLLRALAQDARHAKIMFCVRSLLEEMARNKNIPALGPLEEKVWELQRQESEEAFSSILGDLEALNAAAAAFLRAVHPKNWAYYPNQLVKLYRWVSTGVDEAVLGSDIQRSDDPPFDLMYTFLAFLMDDIFKKSQVASKLLAAEGHSSSLLTPEADAFYRQEMQAAAGYIVRRCDKHVAFAWLIGARPKITYRIDLAQRTCTCGQLFQLGLPCRHFIAASMHFGKEAVLLDTFDPIYKATTYANIYRNLRIEIPIAGDLHKDHSLLPAIFARSTKSKKRLRSAGQSSSAASVDPTPSLSVNTSALSSSTHVSCENVLAPLAKTLRLEFDTDVVNSLGEIV